MAVALLKNILTSFITWSAIAGESMVVSYELVTMSDGDDNFLNEEKDEYIISTSNTDENEAIITWPKRIIEKVNEAKAKKQILDFIEQRADMEVIGFQITYIILCFIGKE